MTGIDEARGEMRLAVAAAMQGAAGLAAMLGNSGRETRDTQAFILREMRAGQLHEVRLDIETDKRAQQQERHNLEVDKKTDEVRFNEAKANRAAMLDGFRAVEIGARINNANTLNQARIKDENDLTAARIDVEQEKTKRANKDFERREKNDKAKEQRERDLHDKRMGAAGRRDTQATAKHKAEMAEIFQRMRHRARRMGLSETLASSQSAATAGMRTTAAYAAAQGTSNWGDRQRQQAADFAERAAQDGVDPHTLVDFAEQAANPGPAQAAGDATKPPEQEMAEKLVEQSHDEPRAGDTGSDPATDSGQQTRDTMAAANLTTQSAPSTDPHADAGPAPTGSGPEPAAGAGADSGP